jgi:L-alanine-DL-glutamate epimerase-like enolase superfamily enzyme
LRFGKKLPKNPAARAALDIALYDAYTKFLDVPLVKYLGQKIKSLPTSITIGIKNVDETIKEAQEYEERGFSVLKVKLGKDLEEDIERIVKLREKFGKNLRSALMRIKDTHVAQTIEFYNRTKSLDVELIEQPLPAKAIEETKKLPADIRKVLAADESLLTPHECVSIGDASCSNRNL